MASRSDWFAQIAHVSDLQTKRSTASVCSCERKATLRFCMAPWVGGHVNRCAGQPEIGPCGKNGSKRVPPASIHGACGSRQNWLNSPMLAAQKRSPASPRGARHDVPALTPMGISDSESSATPLTAFRSENESRSCPMNPKLTIIGLTPLEFRSLQAPPPVHDWWNYDQKAFYNGVSSLDLATSFVGGYDVKVDIDPASCSLKFDVHNVSGWESATRLRKSAKPGGQHQAIIPDHNRGDSGVLSIGGDMTEDWIWKEPKPSS